jgi:hypothetical protein
MTKAKGYEIITNFQVEWFKSRTKKVWKIATNAFLAFVFRNKTKVKTTPKVCVN